MSNNQEHILPPLRKKSRIIPQCIALKNHIIRAWKCFLKELKNNYLIPVMLKTLDKLTKK